VHAFHVKSLAEHTQQQPGLDAPGQCLMKLFSGVWTFTDTVGSLPVGFFSHYSFPATASIFLRRASQNLYVKFSSQHMKKKPCNCSEWPDQTDGKTVFHPLPCQMAGYNLPQFLALSCCLFITEISFLWRIVNVGLLMSLLSIQCIAVQSPLVLNWMSHNLSFTVLHLKSFGMPSIFSPTFPKQLIFSLSVHWQVSGRKISCPYTVCGHVLLSSHVQFVAMSFCLLMYSLWPCPSVFSRTVYGHVLLSSHVQFVAMSFCLLMYSLWPCPVFSCTVCGHVLLSSQQLLSSAVSCVVCPSPSRLSCHTGNHWSHKVCKFWCQNTCVTWEYTVWKLSFLWTIQSLCQLPDFLRDCKILKMSI
jgi:hypothetical protein